MGICCNVWYKALGLIVHLPQFILSNGNETAHLDNMVSDRGKKLNDLKDNNKEIFAPVT